MIYPNKDKLPIQEEHMTFYSESNVLKEILSKFKQLVPKDFIELETKGKNYMCSTEGWKEPACERYIFFDQDKPVQLDIPWELMAELGLTKGQDISYPFYTSFYVLKKDPAVGAITIEDKKEIFIQEPLNIDNLESELTKWLEELISSREKLNNLEQLNNELQTEKETNQSKIDSLEREKAEKERNLEIVNDLITRIQQLLRTDDLNKLPQIPEGESLTSLLERPTPEQVNNLEKTIRSLENKIKGLDDGLQTSQKELKQRNDKIEVLEEELANLQKKLNDAEESRDSFCKQLVNHRCASVSHSWDGSALYSTCSGCGRSTRYV